MKSYRDINICSVCGKPYEDLSDKVYCPVCGASYHRECYKIKNNCVFEELHGTEYEYNGNRAEEMIRRYVAGEEDLRVEEPTEPIKEDNIPKVNLTEDNTQKAPEQATLVINGFAETDKFEDVSVGDIAKFVVFNYERYISLFARMFYRKQKASFNLLAFFFPQCWFFLRKHYLAGFGTSLILAAAKILMIPAVSFLEGFLTDGMSYLEYVSVISANLAQMPTLAHIFLWVGFFVTALIHILCGVFGDLLYKHHAYSKIREYRKEEPDSNGLKLSFIGGVNPLLIFVGSAITTILPELVMAFF